MDVMPLPFDQTLRANRWQEFFHCTVIKNLRWNLRLIAQFDLYGVTLAGADFGPRLIESEPLLLARGHDMFESFAGNCSFLPRDRRQQLIHRHPPRYIE